MRAHQCHILDVFVLAIVDAVWMRILCTAVTRNGEDRASGVQHGATTYTSFLCMISFNVSERTTVIPVILLAENIVANASTPFALFQRSLKALIL